MKKLIEIERLRAFAVLLVMYQHMEWLKELAPPYLREGGTGVDLFFVISGFVVTRSLSRFLPTFSESQGTLERINSARPSLHTFLMRRLYRIAPMALLWAFIPLFLATYWARTGAFGEPAGLAREILAIVTLQYNYAFANGTGGKLSHYWSLAVEEHFYLILPLVFVLCGTAGKRMLALVAGILAVVFFLRPCLASDGPREFAWAYLGFTSHRKFDFLLAGSLLTLVLEQGWLSSWKRMRKWVAVPLSLCLLGVITTSQSLLSGPQFWNGGQVVIWCASGILVLMASLEKNIIFGLWGFSHLMEWIGSRSYGLYLIHMPVIWTLDEYQARNYETADWFHVAYFSRLEHAGAVLGISMVLAELCYRLLEKPLIARGHRITADAPAPIALPSPSAGVSIVIPSKAAKRSATS